MARAYIAAGKLEQAQTALQDVLKINPNYPKATDTMAAIQLSQGHLDQVVSDLSKEIAANPGSIGTRLLLAQAYLAKGDNKDAEVVLNASVSMATTPAAKGAVFQSLGMAKLAEKQYAEAGKLAGEALDQTPKSTVALSVLGASYAAQKQAAQGLVMMQARVDKVPGWAEGYLAVAELAQKTGNSPVAESAFGKALAINHDLTPAMVGLGDTYLANNQLDLAQKEFQQTAAVKDSNLSYALLRLGQIYERKGDIGSARTSYESALTANPNNIIAKNNLAWLYAEHGGNVDLALKLAEEAKEKAPDDPGISDTLGWIYVKKGSYEAAVAALKESTAKDPNNASYLYHLGTAYYRLGDSDQARKELEAALKMPNFSDAEDAKKMLAQLPPR